MNQYFSQLGTKVQLFKSDLTKLEFATKGQLDFYLVNTLGDAFYRGKDLDGE